MKGANLLLALIYYFLYPRHLVYGDDGAFSEGRLPYWREKLSNLSEFAREIKVGFARYYNKLHNRRGYFWGDRFKSVIVEKGKSLINCLAYIDLNPLRAGIVKPAGRLPLELSRVSRSNQKPEQLSLHGFRVKGILIIPDFGVDFDTLPKKPKCKDPFSASACQPYCWFDAPWGDRMRLYMQQYSDVIC